MNKIHFLSGKLRKQLHRCLQLSQNTDALTMGQLNGFLFYLSILLPFILLTVILASIFGTSYPVLDSFEDVHTLDQCIIEAQDTYTKALNSNKPVFPYNVKEDNLLDEMIVQFKIGGMALYKEYLLV